MYNLLTPGPTKVRQNVLLARAQEAPNADLDPDFYAYYHDACAKYSAFLHTKNESFLLSGEGVPEDIKTYHIQPDYVLNNIRELYERIQ